MLDTYDTIRVLRLIMGVSFLTRLQPCYTIFPPVVTACDESQQPSHHVATGIVMQKTCSKCQQPQPLGNFVKDKNRPDGLYPQCKACQAEYRRKNHDTLVARAQQRYQDNGDVIRARNNAYYAANAAEIQQRRHEKRIPRQQPLLKWGNLKADYNFRYNRANREQITQQKREYRSRNRERIREQWRAYRAANLDKKKSYHRQWQRANPDKIAIYTHRRRAWKRGAAGDFTAQEWMNLKAAYGFRCLRCGLHEPDVTLTADHVIPLSQGGSNDIGNIQPLCKTCNTQKHTDATDYR